jgi:peptidoglycan-associated lipoprotein
MGYQNPEVYYGLGQVMKMGEKYEEALVQFETFQKEAPSDPRSKEEIQIIKDVLEFKKNPRRQLFKVENFRNANTAFNDYSPMVLKEQGLVFSSDREEATGKDKYGRTTLKYSDLFILKKVTTGRGTKKVEKWSTPPVRLEGEANSKMNEGTPTFDAKGNTMYFTRCNPQPTVEQKEAGQKREAPNCQIYMAKKKGKGEWTEPTPLPFCTDTVVDYGHPTLSPDGTKMVFAMDDPKGLGGKDLWLVTWVKRSKTWSDPINLGPTINTAQDEMFPYFLDDTTLYFSSDGHLGYGGLDVFKSTGTGETWAKPKNLNYPLNSGGDDFGIVYNEDRNTGFFTSNRNNATFKSRGDDIYAFDVIPLVFTLSGIVYDDATAPKPVPNATVTLLDVTTNKTVTAKTDGSGAYSFKLEHQHDYDVSAEKDGYLGSKVERASTVGLEFSADLTQNLTLKKRGFVIPNVFYDLDDTTLTEASKVSLDTVYQILVEYPKLVIELQAHTDCRATQEYNMRLSQGRANSVFAYLVSKGIAGGRLVPKGYGETRLMNNCACEPNDTGPGANCTEAEHALNRRTMVEIVSFDYRP